MATNARIKPVERATTRSWDEWLQFMDTIDAKNLDHQQTVQGIVVAGNLRVSGTDRRVTWRTKAQNGSSVIVTSEPKKNGAASIVATQIGLATLDANDEARQQWTSIVDRFVEGVGLRG